MSMNLPSLMPSTDLHTQSVFTDLVRWGVLPMVAGLMLLTCLMVYCLKKRGLVIRKMDFTPIVLIVALATLAKHYDLLIDSGARFAKAIWP